MQSPAIVSSSRRLKPPKSSFSRQRERMCLCFLIPALLYIFIFKLVPILASLGLSMTNFDGVLNTFSNMKWVGLNNYSYVIGKDKFFPVLWNTIYFCILCVPVMNAISLFLAYLVTNIPQRRAGLIKTILYYPNLIPLIAGGYAWKLIFNYDKGVVNYILQAIGIGKIDFIGNPKIVMLSLMMVVVWGSVGYYMVIYVAGLIAIPVDLYEAADIEGCNAAQKFFKISLPMLASSLTVNIVLTTMAIFTSFDLIYSMTDGGPGYASTTLAIEVYKYAYVKSDVPAGMAMGVLIGLFAAIIMVFEMKFLLKNEEVYN